MIADKACAERGCACYSPQFGDTDGVEMIRKKWVNLTNDQLLELEKDFRAERVRTSDEEYLVIYPANYWAWIHAVTDKLKELNT